MANGLFGGGDGNPGTPYLVEDGADLNAVRNALGKAYKQVANVDLSAYANWVPIGVSPVFTGIYDGGGFSVSNLNINTSVLYAGLFGNVTGTLLGINVLSGSIISSTAYVGAICGYYLNTLSFCSNQGCTIKGNGNTAGKNYTGGVVGAGTVTDCFNNADINANGFAVAGVTGQGYATRCYNTGNIFNHITNNVVSGNYGGASGVCHNGNANNCYNTGNITSSLTAFPVVTPYAYTKGVSDYSATNCYNTGKLIGDMVFGVCRQVSNKCYNTGVLEGKYSASGVSGDGSADCFNTGSILATTGTGYGVCANNATRCYNTGDIRAFTGGYGVNLYTANNCYALCNTITRITGGTNTTDWAKVSKTTNTTNNYALDTMTLVYE